MRDKPMTFNTSLNATIAIEGVLPITVALKLSKAIYEYLSSVLLGTDAGGVLGDNGEYDDYDEGELQEILDGLKPAFSDSLSELNLLNEIRGKLEGSILAAHGMDYHFEYKSKPEFRKKKTKGSPKTIPAHPDYPVPPKK